MTDGVENLILEHLKAIRAELGKLAEKIDTLTQRVGSLERHSSMIHDDMVSIQMRLDKHDGRLDRIEKRLDLTEA